MPVIKKILFTIFLISGMMAATVQSQAQIPNEILLSFQSGNAKVLSRYFNQNVDLVVLDDQNVYSKAQAQQIVGNFFSNYPPESFSIVHDSGKEGSKYVIGTLKTKNGSFRVYFLLKQNEGKEYIHQLRIEKLR
ncbi:MAG TPA: DUF4783 domain-containing protein [Draconibacterium sp.]|nr:DUF4783 domain-containing protein [Draconibacterium sp.]